MVVIAIVHCENDIVEDFILLKKIVDQSKI